MPGLLVTALLEKLKEFDAFFRKQIGQRENGAATTDGKRGIDHGSAAGEHLKVRGRSGDNFADALDAAGTVLDADDVRMLSQSDDFRGFQSDVGEDWHRVKQNRDRSS